jgi:hypothetical protein
MRTPDQSSPSSAGRIRMRAFVQILGGIVLGVGLAATVGLDPGLLFAAYAVGLGVTLLCLGLLLPADPDTGPTRSAALVRRTAEPPVPGPCPFPDVLREPWAGPPAGGRDARARSAVGAGRRRPAGPRPR